MRNDISSRRGVLRGVLALGCGLWVPMVLSGCDSRKSATSGSSVPATTPAAPAKMAQDKVQYQTQPKGEQKCAACQHFNADSNTCKLVEGQISPNGWCALWTKKA
ncbi:MAG: high-potential iron-sulfur protein [Proteobacteria bacterium]|nr:high-potential iron-sulfur protein [Pseudomonadota bacterium]